MKTGRGVHVDYMRYIYYYLCVGIVMIMHVITLMQRELYALYKFRMLLHVEYQSLNLPLLYLYYELLLAYEYVAVLFNK